jgi:hypothetical protein
MIRRSLAGGLVVAALVLAGASAPASAQQMPSRGFVELLGGGVAPTFDIADVAKTGGAFGATAGLRLGPTWLLMAEADFGRHKDKATSSVDINTNHYIAKVGYSLTGPVARGWETLVNLGAGAVSFDVDGAPETYTYPAINVGAKIAYHFHPVVAFVISPQGNIAFSKKAEVGTDNAWVWPITAGFRFAF